MKKLFAVLLSLSIFAGCLAGCGKEASRPGKPAPTDTWEHSPQTIDFAGFDGLLEALWNTASFRRCRLPGCATLSVAAIDVAVPFETRIAWDGESPAIYAKLEIPAVTLTTAGRTDTYLYRLKDTLYLRRDLYRREMVGFFRYDWIKDRSDYAKCTDQTFRQDPATWLVYLFNLTGLVADRVKSSLADRTAMATAKDILIGCSCEGQSYLFRLSGAELTGNDSVGEILLSLSCGDGLVSSLALKTRLIDAVTLRLEAELADPNVPVDMSVIPEGLADDPRYADLPSQA